MDPCNSPSQGQPKKMGASTNRRQKALWVTWRHSQELRGRSNLQGVILTSWVLIKDPLNCGGGDLEFTWSTDFYVLCIFFLMSGCFEQLACIPLWLQEWMTWFFSSQVVRSIVLELHSKYPRRCMCVYPCVCTCVCVYMHIYGPEFIQDPRPSTMLTGWHWVDGYEVLGNKGGWSAFKASKAKEDYHSQTPK